MGEEYFTFRTGKSAGKTIEQVAAEDYLRLRWFHLNVLNKNNVQTRFADRVLDVLKKLNSFESQLECAVKKPGCEGKAKNISIAVRYNQRTGQCEGTSISTSFIYCNNRLCLDTIDYEPARVVPIRYAILAQMPPFPKYIVKDVQKALNECSGAPKRKTPEACKKWIDDLVIMP